jgi:hypothetical protein
MLNHYTIFINFVSIPNCGEKIENQTNLKDMIAAIPLFPFGSETCYGKGIS